jgi:NADP-dependent 3-hydroxy acid dehydrogenase YdfG
LTGKVAWITGAGTGIGEAAALALAEAGMKVVLSGRRSEKIQSVAEAIGSAARILQLDVADKAAVQQAAESILSEYGQLDVLVASAGINPKARNWHNVSLEDWDQVIRVDLDGAFYCAKAVLPIMIEQRDGLIVNISSWAGRHVSVVTGPAYTAAKICPGEVAPPIMDNRPVPVSDEDRAKMVQAEDCGEIVRFLAGLPRHVCINELTVSPTWNRGYVAQARALYKDSELSP